MKICTYSVIVLAAHLATANASPFQDLDFDGANTSNLVPPVPPGNPPHQDVGSGSVSELLPGWQLLYGGSAYSDLLWLNLNPIGFGLASLYDGNNFFYDAQTHIPVAGKFSFAMFPD